MACADNALILPLVLDGEVDAETAAAFERHRAECADCTLEFARLKELRRALRENLPRDPAPPSLRGTILAAIPDEQPAQVVPIRRRRPWVAGVLSAVGGALAASLVTFWIMHPTAEERLTQEIVSSHVRSLLSGHLTDLAATDPAAVRPWFVGKVDMAPPVKDLSAKGFELAGARLDYVDRGRAAVLVYRHGAHVYTLYVLNTPTAPPGDSDAVQRQGYAVCHWTRSGITFWAVSDDDPEELERFEDLVTGQG